MDKGIALGTMYKLKVLSTRLPKYALFLGHFTENEVRPRFCESVAETIQFEGFDYLIAGKHTYTNLARRVLRQRRAVRRDVHQNANYSWLQIVS